MSVLEIIDFILISNRFRNAVKCYKSMPGADADSDHIPVISKIRIKLRKLIKGKQYSKPQIHLLKKDKELRKLYKGEVKGRYEALEQPSNQRSNPETLWKQFRSVITETIEAIIPKNEKRKKKKWMTDEILSLMKKRRTNKSKPSTYQQIKKEIRKKPAEAKEKWLNEKCDEIENTHSSNSRRACEIIKEVSGKKSCVNTGCLRSKTGEVLMDKDEVLNRWSEYIEELFYDERGEKPLIKKNIEGPEIMKAEVKYALNRMKHGKATGPDNIPAEAIESLEDLGIDMVTKLLNALYDTGAIPTEMSRSVFIALPKKTGATDCELHRTKV